MSVTSPPTSTVAFVGYRQNTAAALDAAGSWTVPSFDSTGRLFANISGEDQLGFVGGAAARVAATLNSLAPALAAAGNYESGDVLSEHATTGHAFVFATAARVAAGSGIIAKAIITSSVEAWAPTMRLWLFHTAPTTSNLNDGVALSITVADRSSLVGYIDFAAGADVGTISYVQNTDVRLPFKCASSSTALYGILQVTEAATNESAGMTLTVELSILQD